MNERMETRCIHGIIPSRIYDEKRSVSFPIYQTATFSHVETGHNTSGFDYTRESNPTRSRLEEITASLEGTAYAFAFSSGMAAINVCFELFSDGDHIVCSDDIYGGTSRLHKLLSIKNRLGFDYTDTSDPANIEKAVKENTKAIYIETPGNPMMRITDIKKCAETAHSRGMLLIADNTFLSPYLQNPAALGADIVIHSASKFLAGHNDTIAGFICVDSSELASRIQLISKTIGCALSPFDSWLVMRGIKTLPVRIEQQQKNAIRIAEWLCSRKDIRKVFYPGLKTHPGYETNLSQARGGGSMISFNTAGKDIALKILKNVRVITFAESLGGTETLITYPLMQTHTDVPEETRNHLGIDETLLRISVGLENADDIINDLKQAMEN